MNNRMIVIGLAALAGCTDGANTSARKDAPTSRAPGSLEAAHKAYLESDFLTVTERIRDVLLDPSSSHLAKENAYELLDKAYEAQSGTLPSTYKLVEPLGGPTPVRTHPHDGSEWSVLSGVLPRSDPRCLAHHQHHSAPTA
jgi:hypothetical protein